ncbi:MAG: HD domain-containing protein [Desulfurococcaceae archaeon]
MLRARVRHSSRFKPVKTLHCYAFKQKTCQETYLEHVEGIIDCMSRSWEYRALSKKLSRMLSISESETESLLHLTAILHDIGKLSDETQRKCIDDECTIFPTHHAISARIASYLASKANLIYECTKKKCYSDIIFRGKDDQSANKYVILFYTLVVFPVLLHNYALTVEKSLVEAIDKTRNIEMINLHRDCVNVIKSLVNKYLISNLMNKHIQDENSIAFKVASILVMRLESSSKIELGVLPIEESDMFSHEYSSWKYVIEAVTGLLNMFDGRVAHRHREERCKA